MTDWLYIDHILSVKFQLSLLNLKLYLPLCYTPTIFQPHVISVPLNQHANSYRSIRPFLVRKNMSKE